MKKLLFAFSLVVSCHSDESEMRTQPGPYIGELWKTPLGFEFYWIWPTSQYREPVELATAIDAAYTAYADLRGFAGSPSFLDFLRIYKIQFYPIHFVEGDDPSKHYFGYWWASHLRIDIAQDGTHYDSHFGMTLSGATLLFHEWEHAVFGLFHKRRPDAMGRELLARGCCQGILIHRP